MRPGGSVEDLGPRWSADSRLGRIAARPTVRILVIAYRSWSADRAARLGAGLAYYSLFALIPVLFLAISLAGILFGREVAGTTVEDEISGAVGSDIASAVSDAIDGLRHETMDSLLPIISLGMLLYTATVLFVAWKEFVDIIWGRPKETGVLAGIEQRLFGLAAVVGAGLLLSLMIFAEMLVGALDRLVGNVALDVLLKITGSIIPGLLGAVFLLVLFRYTPDPRIPWKSVWVAAAVTAPMLAIAGWGYGVYLGTVGFGSASGVAGTLLLGLAFVHYSAQMLLYGVEITKATYDRSGT